MTNSEIIVNLWYILHKPTGVIFGLAGRAYYAGGTDDEKVALLKRLAATDYLLATRFPVPERFEVNNISGCCSVDEPNAPATTLFEEVYQELEGEIAMRLTMGERVALKIPDNPLFVVTCLLENEDGTLTPVL